MESIRDFALLGLFFVIVILLSPILIPLFIIDDIREDNFETKKKAEYYHCYL